MQNISVTKQRAIQTIISNFGTVAIIAAVTLLLKWIESFLEAQVIALLFLLPVLLCTVLWGMPSGILAGLLAFLTFNYFFISPYYTLLIHKTQDLITLIIFLIVAVVLSQFIAQARKATMLAMMREAEATRMYELISALANLTDVQSIVKVLADRLMQTFRFDQIEIETSGRQPQPSFLLRMPDGSEINRICDLSLSMFTSRSTEGEIRLWLDQEKISIEETRLLAAFANQGALAIERVRLIKRENLAKVLEESDRIKTSLLNSVSHELRSPLAAIKASVSSLRSGAVEWESAARVELLTTVEEETDQLNLLVGNLLDMSRIEAGAMKPKQQWNSIVEIIKSVAGKMRSQLQQHQIFYQVEDGLPLVPTDYVLMGQVFTNLFSNSIKYAPLQTAIQVSAKKFEEVIWVKIINQSPAVPEEHLEHIFDKFYRVTRADTVTGTGLGLSICKGIVEAHGGKIWATNSSEGFTFNITLPLTLDGVLPIIPKDEVDG